MLEQVLKRLKIHYLGVKMGLEKIQQRLKQIGLQCGYPVSLDQSYLDDSGVV